MGDMAVSDAWYHGNAAVDGRETRGWLLGHFLGSSAGVRTTNDVEIKWGIHPAGEKRTEWTQDDKRTTVLFLIEGHFVVKLSEGDADLVRQGDYVMWGPGIDHSWEAREDSTVITIRWPSVPAIE